MNACATYSVIAAFILVGILAMMFSGGASASSEDYLDDSPILQPTVSFLERRQCHFPGPDYGQYSYAGCRCSRVGTQMSNGDRDRQNSGLYTFPR